MLNLQVILAATTADLTLQSSSVLGEWKHNNKIISVTHNNTLLFIVTYWQQVSVVKTSSGYPYKIF
jgi:hypothetical protein